MSFSSRCEQTTFKFSSNCVTLTMQKIKDFFGRLQATWSSISGPDKELTYVIVLVTVALSVIVDFLVRRLI